MSWAKLEHHLLFFAQIKGLKMPPSAQIPDMELMAIAALHQQVRLETGLDHIRKAPFAGDHGVMPQVPPEIVSQELWSAIDFPLTQHIKTQMVEEKNAAGTLAAGRTERTYINSFWAAMDGVGTRVICSRREL